MQSPPRRDLSHNRFRGPFPDDALRGKTKLSLLYLNDNELWAQRFPSALLAMTNLAALNVGTNQLEGTIPLALNRLSYLTKLYAPPRPSPCSTPNPRGACIPHRKSFIRHRCAKPTAIWHLSTQKT